MIRGSGDNLQVAMDGETYEVNEMYPAFNAVAQLQEEKGAMQTCTRKQNKLSKQAKTFSSARYTSATSVDTLLKAKCQADAPYAEHQKRSSGSSEAEKKPNGKNHKYGPQG